MASDKHAYVGRFAPSPSGPLHFGSLVCALASYIHARQHKGKWLVRIEDVDTPRVNANMNPIIINSLQQHGLEWDDAITYQSQSFMRYESYLSQLRSKTLLYACDCSRKQIKLRSEAYDGFCRQRFLPTINNALRFKHLDHQTKFNDLFWGDISVSHKIATEDPVLKRADGVFAYHLAVVADDIHQNVSHIVRGYDLYETTPIHIALYRAFEAKIPQYLHIPILVQAPNQKLSKQHHSPPIDDSCALSNLRLALAYLGLKKSMQTQSANIQTLLAWAVQNWHSNMLPRQSELLISTTNDVYSAPRT